MILKLKKKRKPAKVASRLEIDNQPAVLFPDNTATLSYGADSGKVRQILLGIVENL